MSVAAASVRICNIYIEGGPNFDIRITKTDASTVVIPPGGQIIHKVADGITAITQLAVNSAMSTAADVDIG